MAFEPISREEVAAELKDLQRYLRSIRETDTDVRIQVDINGSWTLRSGDASYDQDHRGFWGASSVSTTDTQSELRRIAAELCDQAEDEISAAGLDVDGEL